MKNDMPIWWTFAFLFKKPFLDFLRSFLVIRKYDYKLNGTDSILFSMLWHGLCCIGNLELPCFMSVQLESIWEAACKKYLPSVHRAAKLSVTIAVPENYKWKSSNNYVMINWYQASTKTLANSLLAGRIFSFTYRKIVWDAMWLGAY